MAPSPPKMNSPNNAANSEQNRSLTVMIPRAKYHSQQMAGNGEPQHIPPPHQHHER